MVAASMLVLGWRFVNEPATRDLMAVVGAWTGLNLVLTGLGLGAVCELRERRSVPRVDRHREATLVVAGIATIVQIEDMSFGGLRVRVPPTMQLPARTTGVLRLADPNSPTGLLETPVISVGRRTLDGGRGAGLRFYGVNGDRFRMIAAVAFAEIGSVYGRRQSVVRPIGVVRGSPHDGPVVGDPGASRPHLRSVPARAIRGASIDRAPTLFPRRPPV